MSTSFTHDFWTGDAGPVSVGYSGGSLAAGGGLGARLGPVSTRTSATWGISPTGQVAPASWTLTGDVDLNGVGDIPPTRIETTIDTRITYEWHPERPVVVLVGVSVLVAKWIGQAAQACETAPCW